VVDGGGDLPGAAHATPVIVWLVGHAVKRIRRSMVLDSMAIWPHAVSMAKGRDVFRQQARVLKALAHESRLLIIDRLSQGECSVGELTKLIGSDQSTVSKHLAVLRAHDIVEDRRDGNVVYYTLLTPCVCKFFACATQVLKERR
jgi:DNA-binding transcriptional ArsR family regulator